MERSKRSGRSFQGVYSDIGCGTCIRRRVKCDNVRPFCLTCRAVGIHCTGFKPPSLHWFTQDKTAGFDAGQLHSYVTKEPIYTENEQRLLGKELNAAISNRPVDQSLLELESKIREISGAEAVGVGPFRVFSVRKTAYNPPESIPSVPPLLSTPSSSFQDHYSDSFGPPSILESVQNYPPNNFPTPGNILDWSDLFDLESAFPSDPSHSKPAGLDIQNDVPIESYFSTHEQSNFIVDQLLDTTDIGVESADPSPGISYDAWLPAGMSNQDAQELLRHYSEHVIGHIWSLPLGQKSSMNLHVDAAALTLARRMFLNSKVSHASLSHLYAVLSISANHISHTQHKTSPERWKTFSDLLIIRAKNHWKYSLQHEISPKGAKYKDLLLAVSSLLSYTVLYNQPIHARACMTDSERLLRTLGLAKRTISRKATFLHHTYTWARIVGESTFVLHKNDKQGVAMSFAEDQGLLSPGNLGGHFDGLEASYRAMDPSPRLDDFLGLEPNHPGALAEESSNYNSPLNNMHLEGYNEVLDKDSTMRFLYGVSESWLSLISQTTRLANCIDKASASAEYSGENFLLSLERRKDQLEKLVWSYTTKAEAKDSTGTATRRDLLVRALDHALIIFFYRRIRDVRSEILQVHVDKVVQALQDYDSKCHEEKVELAGSPWPAFIAGCESIGPSRREFLYDWLERSFQSTGFNRVQAAMACMKECWHRWDEGKNTVPCQHWTWVNVSKEKDWYIMLC